ncbi:MAG: maleylpyruvate isomerase family mycothiol-dependent enzyme [Acidimicrobiales bacterium]
MAAGEISKRYRRVAEQFTGRARSVPDDAWDNPAPCEGWVARDVVRHMVDWMPGFFLGGAGVDVPTIPSVDDDPSGAWEVVDRAIQAALDDPEISAREFDMRAGRYRLDDTVATFGLGDVLVHTWDLARATGLDETLDADEQTKLIAFTGRRP